MLRAVLFAKHKGTSCSAWFYTNWTVSVVCYMPVNQTMLPKYLLMQYTANNRTQPRLAERSEEGCEDMRSWMYLSWRLNLRTGWKQLHGQPVNPVPGHVHVVFRLSRKNVRMHGAGMCRYFKHISNAQLLVNMHCNHHVWLLYIRLYSSTWHATSSPHHFAIDLEHLTMSPKPRAM